MDLQPELPEGNKAIDSNIASYIAQQEWTDEQLAERDDLPAISLDERGMILDCNKPFETLFGFDWRDLVWHHITKVFPQLSTVEFTQAGQVYPLLDYLVRCSQLYQAKNRDGVTFSSNLIFVRLEHEGKRLLRLIVFPSEATKS
jgi:hypothetical protein